MIAVSADSGRSSVAPVVLPSGCHEEEPSSEDFDNVPGGAVAGAIPRLPLNLAG